MIRSTRHALCRAGHLEGRRALFRFLGAGSRNRATTGSARGALRLWALAEASCVNQADFTRVR
jgi:hypothetical protein